jgi:hypothetical protein
MTVKNRLKNALIYFVGAFIVTAIIVYFMTESTNTAFASGAGAGFGWALMVLLFGTVKSRMS